MDAEMEIGSDDLVEVEGHLRFSTERTVVIFDGRREATLPRRLVEEEDEGLFSMPAWLASDRGLTVCAR